MRVLMALWRACANKPGTCRHCGRPLTSQEMSLAHLLTICADCYKKHVTN